LASSSLGGLLFQECPSPGVNYTKRKFMKATNKIGIKTFEIFGFEKLISMLFSSKFSKI
jgi:hypothetical protein